MNHDVMNTMMIYVLLLQAQLFGNYHNVKLIYEVFSKSFQVGPWSIEYESFSHILLESFQVCSSGFKVSILSVRQPKNKLDSVANSTLPIKHNTHASLVDIYSKLSSISAFSTDPERI